MQDKEEHKNRKKMNTLELLYNKALMKAAADKADNVKKTKVWSSPLHNSQSSIQTLILQIYNCTKSVDFCKSWIYLKTQKIDISVRNCFNAEQPICVPCLALVPLLPSLSFLCSEKYLWACISSLPQQDFPCPRRRKSYEWVVQTLFICLYPVNIWI